jgi:hypothetical protein
MLLLCCAVACRSAQSTGSGEVIAIDADRAHVTVRRDDVPGVASGVVIRLAVPDPALLADVQPGGRLDFDYRDDAVSPRLIAARARPAAPLVHDHTPHHGGTVAMVGDRHVEARAEANGHVAVYLTDFFRRPLPIGDARGTVALALPGGARTIALAPDGDALAGSGPALDVSRADAHVALAIGPERLDVDFVLPIVPGVRGAAGVAGSRCVRPDAGAPSGLRCAIAFGATVTALAVSPDGATLLVGVAGAGVSAWRLPDGELAGGLEPAPPIAVPAGEQPHPEVAARIAWRPGAAEALVVYEGRLLLYALPDGRLVRVLPGPGGLVRDVAWLANGRAVVVVAFSDVAAHLLDAEDGHEIARYPLAGEPSAVAVMGEHVVVGAEDGTIAVFATGDGVEQTLRPTTRAVQSLAVTDEALLALAQDGIVRGFSNPEMATLGAVEVGFTPTPLAADPHGTTAVGLPGGRVAILDFDRGVVARTLVAGEAQILAVARPPGTVVAGDAAGRVTLWDVAD